MSNEKLLDPRDMYYQEKFPEQESQSPAIQKDMTPRPDCGETSYKGKGRLEGRNALITGGDSGIGRAVAIAYAREGANVAIHYLPGEEADAEEVKQLIEEAGQKAKIIPGDFRKEGVASQVFDEAYEALGQIDLLVLNAAQQFAQKDLESLSMQQVKDTFNVNVISMFEMVKTAEKRLPTGASIITTTSVQSFDPSDTLMDYAATNSAVSSLTVSLSTYFAEKGIRVNGVAPGPIWTPLQLDGGQLPGGVTEFGQKSLLGRAGQPVELAPVYVFLASKEASYVTGQIYGITGGQNINL
ncbi:SDR family oxidoreductase [Facklamia sp. DSM 111018]|uniref:SDR family oxidoreductase n=1 Tax=Facklamia lactis TaxID=2749967 RepID=A0ABS0LRA8_9LACT|nr:SDR family oxidoreductase [Facklamia lactis]MBG9980953.1 SDR family oxidoreductase [Facklamia lactis]MBG9986684.1 SDR family oxidoreductase [Facklamia lactis]